MTEEEKKKSEELNEDDDLDLDDLLEDEEEEDAKKSTETPKTEEEGKKDKASDDDHSKDKSETDKEEQSKDERSRQAKARREREEKERKTREEQIRKDAYLKGKLDSTKVNKFTNEPIEDEYDLTIYETQLQLEKEGKDPETDLPKRLAEINRQKAKEETKKASEREKLNERIDKEFSEFRDKYPSVKINELLKDADFQDYAGDRLGRGDKSLAQLYDNFQRLKEKFGEKKKTEEEDDGKRVPPSPNGGRKQEKTSYSSMSKEEKIKELRRQGLIN